MLFGQLGELVSRVLVMYVLLHTLIVEVCVEYGVYNNCIGKRGAHIQRRSSRRIRIRRVGLGRLAYCGFWYSERWGDFGRQDTSYGLQDLQAQAVKKSSHK